MIDLNLHRDIAGRELFIGSHVILCEHNRIIVGQIIRLYETLGRVRIQPSSSSAGLRRGVPSNKPIIRNSYNLFLVTDQELVMAILRGAV